MGKRHSEVKLSACSLPFFVSSVSLLLCASLLQGQCMQAVGYVSVVNVMLITYRQSAWMLPDSDYSHTTDCTISQAVCHCRGMRTVHLRMNQFCHYKVCCSDLAAQLHECQHLLGESIYQSLLLIANMSAGSPIWMILSTRLCDSVHPFV